MLDTQVLLSRDAFGKGTLSILLTLLITFAAPVSSAGTVLTYGYGSDETSMSADESATVAVIVEIQKGRLRWQGMEEERWELFDPAVPIIREFDPAERVYDEHDEHDEYADPDAAETVQRTTPKRLGKTQRNGHPCVMYSIDDDGVDAKTCLAEVGAFDMPAEDAATLQAFADFVHRLMDRNLYSNGLPLAFSTVSGVGVSNVNYELLKVEQRDLPRERFEMPQGYTRYVPKVDEDGL